MRISGSSTILYMAVTAIALSGATDVAAQRTGSRSTVDRRPLGVGATPYDLEVYETAVGSKPSVQGDPATFELFGFKLGMSVREADRNARRLGLRFNGGNEFGPSFDGRVQILAANLLGRDMPKVPRTLTRTSMIDPDGNRFMLRFVPMEAGATLVTVTYAGSWEGNTPSQYLAALKSRFGKPTSEDVRADSLNARWCSKGDPLSLCDDRPALGVTGGGEVNMELIMGVRVRTELDHRIELKAAAVAAGQRKRPTF